MNLSAKISARWIPVARPSIGPEEEAAVLEVLRSGWLSQGPRIAEFEERFAAYVGAPCAVATSSCTTALHLALHVLGIGPRDEVVCPSLSFIATANTIVHTGAEPIFVDIDRATYNLDANRLEAAISPRTRAILTVHQVGLPSALTGILEIAQRFDLPVIEDAACAIGSEYRGSLIGAPHALMACFSFHPRKILTTGEGGMITVADPGLAVRLRQLRQHAMSVPDLVRHDTKRVVIESYGEVGYNYRMTDLQAAVGVVQLRRLPDFLRRRRSLAKRYTEALSKLGWLIPPHVPAECHHNYQSYIARLTPEAPVDRNRLMQALLDRGISTRRGVMAIHREAPYREPRWERNLTETNAAADETLILPLFYQMTEEEQDYVIECLEDIGTKHAT